MAIDPNFPLPLDPMNSHNVEDRRLWVGNLDLRINEYQLLKLVQQYGAIEKFDLLFHRSGPQAGQSRGYAFVTYKTLKDAETAMAALHTRKVGTKHIVVRWAHKINEAEMEKTKSKLEIPALAGAKKEDKRICRESAIEAIKTKLKMMNESKEEFELNKPLTTGVRISPPESRQPPETQRTLSGCHRKHEPVRHLRKPYSQNRPRR